MELVDLTLAEPVAAVHETAIAARIARVGDPQVPYGDRVAAARALLHREPPTRIASAIPRAQAGPLLEFRRYTRIALVDTVIGERVLAADPATLAQEPILLERIRNRVRIGDVEREHADEATARTAFEVEIAHRRAAGQLIVDRTAQALAATGFRDVGLEEAIADASDADRRSAIGVYADWLQERGDPRGEHLAFALQSTTPATSDRFARLQARFADRFAADPFVTVRWADGLIDEVRISFGAGPDRDPLTGTALRDTIEDLVILPSARLLRTLICTEHAAGAVVDLVLAFGPPTSLESLELGPGGFDPRTDPSVGRARELIEQLPRLRRLALCALSLELEGLVHPRLADVRLIGDLGDRALCAAIDWPALSSLDLRFQISTEYPSGDDSPPKLASFERLFAEAPPGLVHLALRGPRDADAVCRALARSPLVGRLETLTLQGGFGDDGVSELAVQAHRLANLRQLELAWTKVRSVDALRARFGDRLVVRGGR